MLSFVSIGYLRRFPARAHLCLQEGNEASHQHVRARPTRPLSHQRMGVQGRQYPACRPDGRVIDASDGKACPDDRRRNQGRFWRNNTVLDLFGGLGSTLIAADKTGRRGFLCELDPVYCDRIIARWEGYAHDDAVSHNGRRTDGGGPRTDPNPSCLGRPTPVWIASNPYRGTKA